MTLDVSRVLAQPGVAFPFSLEQTADQRSIEDTGRFPDEVEVTDIEVSGTLTSAGTCVFLRGDVKASVKSQCARCLADVSADITSQMSEVFGEHSDPTNPEQRQLSGHTIDISDCVYSALILALPMRYLCRDDCAGIT